MSKEEQHEYLHNPRDENGNMIETEYDYKTPNSPSFHMIPGSSVMGKVRKEINEAVELENQKK